MAGIRELLHRDEGLTLVEVLMYCILLPLVLAIVTTLLISLGHTKITVMNSVKASTSMQSVVSSVSNGIRSSTAFKVLAVAGGNDQLLEARVAVGPSSFVCSVWYYSATGKTLSYKSSTTAITAPSAAVLSHWTKLATDIAPTSGTTIFTPVTIPTPVNPQLGIAFKVAPGSTKPASVSTAVISRSENWTGGTCFTV